MSRSIKIKVGLAVVSVIAAIAAAVAGTLAFLSDREQVNNTFTVGNVDITLNEIYVDDKGVPILDEEGNTTRVLENEYHLIPDWRYSKDPTVTVLEGSEESYVRIIITIENAGNELRTIMSNHSADGLTYADFVDDDNANDQNNLGDGWEWVEAEGGGPLYNAEKNSLTFEFRYTGTVSGGTAPRALPALFTKLVVPDCILNSELHTLVNMEMSIEAHAIQADGFDGNINAAWKAFEEQVSQAAQGAH